MTPGSLNERTNEQLALPSFLPSFITGGGGSSTHLTRAFRDETELTQVAQQIDGMVRYLGSPHLFLWTSPRGNGIRAHGPNHTMVRGGTTRIMPNKS